MHVIRHSVCCIILDHFVENVYHLNNEYDDCDCYRGNLWLYHDWYSLYNGGSFLYILMLPTALFFTP